MLYRVFLNICLLQYWLQWRKMKKLRICRSYYILLETARYLVWRPCAMSFPVLLFFNSTLATPTALPTRRILASISISSYKNRNRKLQMKNKSQIAVLKLFYKCRGASWIVYTNSLTRKLLWWMKLTPRINVDADRINSALRERGCTLYWVRTHNINM